MVTVMQNYFYALWKKDSLVLMKKLIIIACGFCIVFSQSTALAAIKSTQLNSLFEADIQSNYGSFAVEPLAIDLSLQVQNNELNSQIENVRKLFGDLNYSAVIKSSTKALEKYPETAVLMVLRGWAYVNIAHYQLAQKDLKGAQTLLPDNIEISNFIIQGLIREAKLTLAESEIIKLQQNTPNVFSDLLGAIYIKRAEIKKALASAKISLNQKPNNFLALSIQYEACERLGDRQCMAETKKVIMSVLSPEPIVENKTEKTQGAEVIDPLLVSTPLYYHQVIAQLEQDNKINAAVQIADSLIHQYPAQLDGYLAKIRLLVNIRAYQDAEKVVGQVKVLFPELTGVHGMLAELYHLQGDYPQSLKHYLLQIKRTPELAIYAENYGNVLVEAGLYEQAIVFYTKALKKFPTDYFMRIRLAKSYRESNKLPLAIEHYQYAIKERPKRSVAYRGLAFVKRVQQKLSESEQLFKQSIILDPMSYEGSMGMAIVKNDLNMPVEAEIFARKAIELAPNNPTTYSPLADALFLQNKKQEAKQVCQKVEKEIAQTSYQMLGVIFCYEEIELFSKARSMAETLYKNTPTPNTAGYLARAYKRDGEWKQAAILYQQILRDNAENTTVLNDYAWSLVEQKKYQQALVVFDKSLAISERGVTLLNKGLAFSRMQDYKQAKKLFLKSLEVASNQPTLYFLIADSFVNMRENRQAIPWFKRAIQAEPLNVNVYYAYAYNYYLLGDQEKFLAEIEVALQHFPENINLLRNAYSAVSTAGKGDRSIFYLEKIIALGSATAKDYEQLGINFAQNGRVIEAEKNFKKAIKADPYDASFYSDLGYLYFMQKKFNKALGVYRIGLKQPEADKIGILQYNIALTYYATQQFKQALIYLNHAKRAGYHGNKQFEMAIKRAL